MSNVVNLLHKLHIFGHILSIKSGCVEHMDFGKPVVLPQCWSKSAHSPTNRKITLRLEYCVQVKDHLIKCGSIDSSK